MNRHFTVVCGLFFLVFSGCVKEFESQSRIDKFRIVAVKLQPPSALPGEMIRVTPVVSDPSNGKSPIIVFLVCEPFPHQTGRQCLEGGGIFTTYIGDKLEFEAGQLQEGKMRKEVYVTVLACAGSIIIPDFEELEYKFCAGGPSDIAIKKVLIESREDRNCNPEIARVEFHLKGGEERVVLQPGDGPFSAGCNNGCGQVDIKVYLPRESIQEYEVVRFGENQREVEALFVSWFSTAGSFSHSRTFNYKNKDGEIVFSNDYDFPTSNSEDFTGDDIDFYFVVYDGRGGVDYFTTTWLINSDGN